MKVLVVYYSMYGHVYKLAGAAAMGHQPSQVLTAVDLRPKMSSPEPIIRVNMLQKSRRNSPNNEIAI